YMMNVVQKSGYLKEFRVFYFDETDKQSYSNAETVDLFEEHFQMIYRLYVQYTKEFVALSIPSLMKMTPLTWIISEEKVQSFIDNNTNQITVDLEILIGKRLV